MPITCLFALHLPSHQLFCMEPAIGFRHVFEIKWDISRYKLTYRYLYVACRVSRVVSRVACVSQPSRGQRFLNVGRPKNQPINQPVDSAAFGPPRLLFIKLMKVLRRTYLLLRKVRIFSCLSVMKI